MPVLVECADIRENVTLAKRLGLNFVELNASFPQYHCNDILLAEAKALREETGINYTLHLDEEGNPFDFHPTVAAAYRQVCADGLRFAKALGMKRVNMHLPKGVYVTLPAERIYLCEVYYDTYRQAVLDFRAMCEEILAGSDTLVCVENTDGFFPYHLKAIDTLLESSRFALTLDTGHNGERDGRDWPLYEARRDRLKHMHLHACVNHSPHKPLDEDEGTVNVPEKIRLAEESGCTVCVEVKTVAGLESSVQYLKERGKLK